jgi:hypothetical protein
MYLGGVSVLLIAFNLYLNIKSNKELEDNRRAYNTIENVQNNYLDPQNELVKLFPEGFFLYASMNQDTRFTQQIPKVYDPTKRKIVELYGSLRVLQAIEDFLTTAPYDITGIYIWLNVFLLWMQSPILQSYWHITASSFSDDMQNLMDIIVKNSNALIELRKKKGTLTNEDYDAISIPLARSYESIQ